MNNKSCFRNFVSPLALSIVLANAGLILADAVVPLDEGVLASDSMLSRYYVNVSDSELEISKKKQELAEYVAKEQQRKIEKKNKYEADIEDYRERQNQKIDEYRTSQNSTIDRYIEKQDAEIERYRQKGMDSLAVYVQNEKNSMVAFYQKERNDVIMFLESDCDQMVRYYQGEMESNLRVMDLTRESVQRSRSETIRSLEREQKRQFDRFSSRAAIKAAGLSIPADADFETLTESLATYNQSHFSQPVALEEIIYQPEADDLVEVLEDDRDDYVVSEELDELTVSTEESVEVLEDDRDDYVVSEELDELTVPTEESVPTAQVMDFIGKIQPEAKLYPMVMLQEAGDLQLNLGGLMHSMYDILADGITMAGAQSAKGWISYMLSSAGGRLFGFSGAFATNLMNSVIMGVSDASVDYSVMGQNAVTATVGGVVAAVSGVMPQAQLISLAMMAPKIAMTRGSELLYAANLSGDTLELEDDAYGLNERAHIQVVIPAASKNSAYTYGAAAWSYIKGSSEPTEFAHVDEEVTYLSDNHPFIDITPKAQTASGVEQTRYQKALARLSGKIPAGATIRIFPTKDSADQLAYKFVVITGTDEERKYSAIVTMNLGQVASGRWLTDALATNTLVHHTNRGLAQRGYELFAGDATSDDVYNPLHVSMLEALGTTIDSYFDQSDSIQVELSPVTVKHSGHYVTAVDAGGVVFFVDQFAAQGTGSPRLIAKAAPISAVNEETLTRLDEKRINNYPEVLLGQKPVDPLRSQIEMAMMKMFVGQAVYSLGESGFHKLMDAMKHNKPLELNEPVTAGRQSVVDPEYVPTRYNNERWNEWIRSNGVTGDIDPLLKRAAEMPELLDPELQGLVKSFPDAESRYQVLRAAFNGDIDVNSYIPATQSRVAVQGAPFELASQFRDMPESWVPRTLMDNANTIGLSHDIPEFLRHASVTPDNVLDPSIVKAMKVAGLDTAESRFEALKAVFDGAMDGFAFNPYKQLDATDSAHVVASTESTSDLYQTTPVEGLDEQELRLSQTVRADSDDLDTLAEDSALQSRFVAGDPDTTSEYGSMTSEDLNDDRLNDFTGEEALLTDSKSSDLGGWSYDPEQIHGRTVEQVAAPSMNEDLEASVSPAQWQRYSDAQQTLLRASSLEDDLIQVFDESVLPKKSVVETPVTNTVVETEPVYLNTVSEKVVLDVTGEDSFTLGPKTQSANAQVLHSGGMTVEEKFSDVDWQPVVDGFKHSAEAFETVRVSDPVTQTVVSTTETKATFVDNMADVTVEPGNFKTESSVLSSRAPVEAHDDIVTREQFYRAAKDVVEATGNLLEKAKPVHISTAKMEPELAYAEMTPEYTTTVEYTPVYHTEGSKLHVKPLTPLVKQPSVAEQPTLWHPSHKTQSTGKTGFWGYVKNWKAARAAKKVK